MSIWQPWSYISDNYTGFVRACLEDVLCSFAQSQSIKQRTNRACIVLFLVLYLSTCLHKTLASNLCFATKWFTSIDYGVFAGSKYSLVRNIQSIPGFLYIKYCPALIWSFFITNMVGSCCLFPSFLLVISTVRIEVSGRLIYIYQTFFNRYIYNCLRVWAHCSFQTTPHNEIN